MSNKRTMKRHLGTDPAQDREDGVPKTKARRMLELRGRDDEEEPAGFLDLNATPRSFDLNAPLADEDSSHGNSGWLSPQNQFEGKNDTAESKARSSDELQPSNSVKVEGDEKSEQSGSSDVPTEGESGFEEKEFDEESLSTKELHDEPESKSPVVPLPKIPQSLSAIFQQPLEAMSALGIDDDLDIIRLVWTAYQQKDAESLDNVLVEACEELLKSPISPSRYHYLSCLYISKKIPEAFSLPRTFKVLLAFLKNSSSTLAGGKRQIMLPLLACKILFRAYATEPDWPLEFVQVYLEDATGARFWIEHEGCKEFVINVLTAFPDVDVDISGAGGMDESNNPRPQDLNSVEGTQGQTIKSESAISQSQGVLVRNRYPLEEIRGKVRTEFLQALNQLLGTASTKDNPRQLLKLLMQGAGYEEVRVVGSSMLEAYLNNPVHLRAAKALLDRILQHTRGTSDNDFNTVANLLALRITSMQAPGQIKSIHGNIFGDMVTQLVRRKSEYATLALKTFVTAEVSSKNLHNMKSIILVLKAMPESPPPEHELALILQELAANDECRYQLKDLVRRMMRQVGSELNVHAVCHGLMQPWPAMAEQDESLKDAWLKQLVDLSCQLLLHAIAPFALDETVLASFTSSPVPGSLASATSVSGANAASFKEKLSALEKFSLDTAKFQVEAMAWCTDVLAVYLPSIDESQFTRIVRQLLFLEESEVYFTSYDNTSEADVASLRLISACMPAPEEILARLILMAISNYAVNQGEALKIIEALVWRAAALRKHLDGALLAVSEQLPAAILKLASFKLPGATRQPIPHLVVKDVYWQACLVVLIIAVYNTSTLGWFVWESVPTLRCFMEALLTCSRKFRPICGDEVSISEATKFELEAEERDSKAEDAISTLLDVGEQRHSEPCKADRDGKHSTPVSPVTRSTNQGSEWKGKVMFLNQAGHIRRPPKSAIAELDRLDEIYQLGQQLRKSRNPDFLGVITSSQTLPQAWPWLQKVVAGEPEVITYLPPVWQCELLFMHEGYHPLTRKLQIDAAKLQCNLRQMLALQVTSKDGEIEAIVGFLSQKLVSKSSIGRTQAHRCFSRLFDFPVPHLVDSSMSVPSSPQENKKLDALGGTQSSGPPGRGSSTNDITSGHLKKAPATSNNLSQISSSTSTLQISSFSGTVGGFLKVSPGFNQPMANEDLPRDKVASWTRVPSSEDDCTWLEVIEKLPTAARVVSALSPAIQMAMQQETSMPVVKAYLRFLKKHLSWTSLTWSIASFIVCRKMLASCLLLGTHPGVFSKVIDGGVQGSNYDSATIDIILECLCKALESGTAIDISWDESSPIKSEIVSFVSPKSVGDSKDATLVCVKVHKVVIDAALEVLSILGQEETGNSRIKDGFQQLSKILFPSLEKSNGWLVWLEEGCQKKSILSETQAMTLVRTRDTRLINAGLSVLSLEAKLHLCEGFGLSPIGAAALLEDLNPFKDSRLELLLRSGSFAGQRRKALRNCVSNLSKSKIKIDSNLLRFLEQLSGKEDSAGFSILQKLKIPLQDKDELSAGIRIETVDVLKIPPNQSLEELAKYVFEELTANHNMTSLKSWQGFGEASLVYMNFRHRLQKLLVGHIDDGLIKSVKIISDLLEKGDIEILSQAKFLSLGLPILELVLQCLCCTKEGLGLQYSSDSTTVALSVSQQRFLSVLSSLETRLQEYATKPSSAISERFQSLGLAASCLLEEKTRKAKAWLTTPAGDWSVQEPFNIIPKYQLPSLQHGVADQNDNLLKTIGVAPVYRVEAILRGFLFKELSYVWDENRNTSKVSDAQISSRENNIGSLLRVLMQLLKQWSSNSKPARDAYVDETAYLRTKVVFNGCCGLIVEFLEFLDPEFSFEEIFAPIFEISRPKVGLADLPHPSLAIVAFGYVVHKSSWQTISRLLRLMLHSDSEEIVNCRSGVTRSILTSTEGSQVWQGAEFIMEFVSACVQHPRSKLALRPWDEVEKLEATSNFAISWLGPSSVSALVTYAVGASATAMLDNAGKVETSSAEFCKQPTSGHEEIQYLKVLLLAAYQGAHVMGVIVQQMSDFVSGKTILSVDAANGAHNSTVVREAAAVLLRGLYLEFPVAVKSMIFACGGTGVQDVIMGQGRSVDRWKLHGQKCSMDSMMHGALRTMCSGNEKESNAAFAFCQEFSRQHPALMIPQLATLTVRLKESLLLLKQGDLQLRTTITRAFSMGLGLLDALRPTVMLLNNNLNNSLTPLRKVRSAEGLDLVTGKPHSELEVVLGLYFEVLQGLDVQDRPLFAKVVARLADFLCHCVTAGGRCREFVAAHRTPLLKNTAHIFVKVKKLVFLLGLLDKAPANQLLEESSAHLGRSLVSPLPVPALHLEDVLKVKIQLQHCIKVLRALDTNREHNMALYKARKSVKCFLYTGVDMTEGSLLATLNDLEKASSRMPAILSVLGDSLVSLMGVKDAAVRDRIYNLLERTLLHCPSDCNAENIVQCLLQQLSSCDVLQAKSAARNACRFFYFCSELQEAILVEMLQMGRTAEEDLQQLVQGLLAVSSCTSA